MTLGEGGADEVLDGTARAAYRARVEALDVALDEAGAAGRAATQLAAERSALIAELTRNTGLGGRSRRLGDPAQAGLELAVFSSSDRSSWYPAMRAAAGLVVLTRRTRPLTQPHVKVLVLKSLGLSVGSDVLGRFG